MYENKLVQELVIIATYLNPQIRKPTDTVELKCVVDLVRKSLQRRYSAEINSRKNSEPKTTNTSLFAVMFQPPRGDGGKGDEVDQYLSIGIV